MWSRYVLGAVLLAALIATPALAESLRVKAPEGAEVYFIAPSDGATVSSPVTVKFGLKGLGVAPAGTEGDNTGHHHLLVDQKLEDYENAIPKDDKHIHFGGGQTEATVELSPGSHALQLVVGDLNHIPHQPPIESEVITVTVE
jgi:hypothetical protein